MLEAFSVVKILYITLFSFIVLGMLYFALKTRRNRRGNPKVLNMVPLTAGGFYEADEDYPETRNEMKKRERAELYDRIYGGRV